jgi:hypothetical protein
MANEPELQYELRIERLSGYFVGIQRSNDLDGMKETAGILKELGFCTRIITTNNDRIVEKIYAENHYWEDDKKVKQ